MNVKKQQLLLNGYQNFQDWINKPNNVYIGRNMSFYVPFAVESKWKNPFSAKKYGLDKCIEMYKNYLMSNKKLLDDLDELDGKVLGCWCKPNKCHGDVLVELLRLKKNNKI